MHTYAHIGNMWAVYYTKVQEYLKELQSATLITNTTALERLVRRRKKNRTPLIVFNNNQQHRQAHHHNQSQPLPVGHSMAMVAQPMRRNSNGGRGGGGDSQAREGMQSKPVVTSKNQSGR